MRALFVTAHLKSLGETFTLARFADDLQANGWRAHFLAFEFAGYFLRAQGFSVGPLGNRAADNHRLFAAAIREFHPDVIFVPDLYLFESSDAATLWSNSWLFESGVPVVSFDHLRFYPDNLRLRLAFRRLLEGPGADPFHFDIHPLPPELAGVVRPCPPHDPEYDPEPGFFKFNDSYAAKASPDSGRIYEEYGFSDEEKLVMVPVGSWAVGLSRDCMVPYYDCYASLLSRYLSGALCPVRVIFIGGDFKESQFHDGNVVTQFVPSLPFDRVQDLLRNSSLVVADNLISSSLSRAVMAGVPAAAMVSSLDTLYDGGQHRFEAPFGLTDFVSEWLERMETSHPNAVYPFSVYPLGWSEELRPLFDHNPYARCIQRIELFDEANASRQIQLLLLDQSVRENQRRNQEEYARSVRRLPGPANIAEELLRSYGERGSARAASALR